MYPQESSQVSLVTRVASREEKRMVSLRMFGLGAPPVPSALM
jgi:hypothetical protein